MTADMCPFISKEYDKKPCQGCILTKKARSWQPDLVMDESAVSKEKQRTIIPLELYKLKRVTTTEEDHPLESVTRKKRAKELLNIIINLHSPDTPSLKVKFDLDYGDGLFNIGEYDSAMKHYNSAKKLEPKERRSWNNIGVTMVRQGNIKEALAYYDKALELDPAFGMAWFNKGKASFKLGLEKIALDCFKNATKYSPKNKSAWNNLGVTLRHMKKFKEAIKCYDKAIKIHTNYPWAWHNKGVALMDLKRYKDAMRCFDKALRIDPKYKPAKEMKREVLRKLL
jgi:tetratricopeptide (TPR) repeat protein